MEANFLKKIFYLPNYLSMPVAGIEICNRSIKYIEFINKKGVFSMKNFGEVPLLPGIVKNGDILNKSALTKALIEVKNSISSDFVKISIPEEKTYIFDAQIPKEAQNNIREALEFKIEENVPLELGESSFEYEIVNNGGQLKDIILNVSVIPKRIIADYTEVLDHAGIYPLSFEIESKMIANSVILKGEKRNSIIVNIKDDSTVLIAIIDGFVRLTSSVSVGERSIRESLLKTGLFENEVAIDKFFETDSFVETTETKEPCSSLVNIFSILKDEVEKFNKYIIDRFPDIGNTPTKNIDNIILCGRSSALPSLTKHINQNLNIEVVLANVWLNIFDIKEHTSSMKFQDSLRFVTPIGLVVSSYKQINA